MARATARPRVATGLRGGARIAVHLTPRAGIDSIDGFGGGGELRVRVCASPIDGAANDALLRLLARALDVPVTGVRIAGGHRGRRKLVEVDRLDLQEVAARLGRSSARAKRALRVDAPDGRDG